MLIHYAANLLASHVPIPLEEIQLKLAVPPRSDMGDVAFPCFTLSKIMHQSPHTIAEQLSGVLNKQHKDIRAEATSGYVNLFFQRSVWGGHILKSALSEDYGFLDIGKGTHVVIDLSSPNIAKPFGIGHLRSTMIGNALANLYRTAGYRVTTVNHLGDWGTQFGKLIAAYKRWGNPDSLQAEPIKESLRLYVKFHDEVEKSPELENEARNWFLKLETGDEETLSLWEFFVTESMKEFNSVYERLGVRFDYVLGESFYNDKMGAAVTRLRELSLLEESDGAQVVRLDDPQMPPCLILKSDGTTIYPTRDLATALYRKYKMEADELLYVVGAEQALHFQQVFAVLRKMGETWTDQCRHIPFGLMKVEGKKMSTRKGKVVFLNEVLDEAVEKAKENIEQKNPTLPDKEAVAEAVGVGAIVFGDLKNRRMLSVDFKLEDAVSFEGETGPYLQYTYARISSLLSKGNYADLKTAIEEKNTLDSPYYSEHLSSPAAWSCLQSISGFEGAIIQALREDEPSIVARYLLDVARDFNRFYNEGKILGAKEDLLYAKLSLAAAAASILRKGLHLLGLQSPEQM